MLATMMMVGCAEQQLDLEAATKDVPAQEAGMESLDDLMAQARWGDGKAYLKLAESYVKGENGVRPDLMASMSMLLMAKEYGEINRPEDYMNSLPEDDNTRMAFEAMESIEGAQKERGLELADRLVSKGCADGYAVKGYASLEAGDTIEAQRLASMAAAQGSSLGMALQYVIPYAKLKSMPDESVMIPLCERVPIFYLFMAEDVLYKLADNPENDVKAAQYYLKADEKGSLDRRGASWLLNFMECGNKLPLTGSDLQRLKRLAYYGTEETPTVEYNELDDGLWGEPIDSVEMEEVVRVAEEAVRAVEESRKAREENNNNE